ncbi:MAG: hypothetical protein WC850_06770 [Candidatus Gracilibacteria bacterium]
MELMLDGLDGTEKKEIEQRVMAMDLNGVPESMINGIVEDIISGDIPPEISETKKSSKMDTLDKFMAISEENKKYVEDLIFRKFSPQEIVETIKKDENVSIN